jgi:iron-sulfur cluster repair protein YtfE (RIC family)
MQPVSENDGPARSVRKEPARAGSSTWDSVSACLQHDHRVMDAILTDVDAFAQERELRVAAEHFAHFRARLLTHMEVEETIVFPAYEFATSCSGPTLAMRREHEEIRDLLRAVGDSLSGVDSAGAPSALLEELAIFLDRHDEKEERVIYPAVDANTRASELGPLVASIEAFIGRGRD